MSDTRRQFKDQATNILVLVWSSSYTSASIISWLPSVLSSIEARIGTLTPINQTPPRIEGWRFCMLGDTLGGVLLATKFILGDSYSRLEVRSLRIVTCIAFPSHDLLLMTLGFSGVKRSISGRNRLYLTVFGFCMHDPRYSEPRVGPSLDHPRVVRKCT